MSESSFSGDVLRSALGERRRRQTESTVYIDVGARRIQPNVIRDGLPIGVLNPDPDRLSQIIAQRPSLRARIISQSVPPGTPVPVGTTVSVELARAGGLPVGVIQETHVDLREAVIDEAFTRFVAGNPQVGVILSRSAAAPLTPEDEQRVREVFAAGDVTITDEPGRDVGAALNTLRVLSAFGR